MYADSVADRITLDPSDAERSAAPDQVVIDRPVSYDIYRNVHKGIRLEMFAVTTDLGSLDPDDVAACRCFASRFRALEELLTRHAMHEDGHLEEAIREALGDRALSSPLRTSSSNSRSGGSARSSMRPLAPMGRLAGPRSTWRTSNWRPSSAPTCTIRTTRSAS